MKIWGILVESLSTHTCYLYLVVCTHTIREASKANRGKDPLYLFAALQRQLGYPAVPRPRTGKDLKLPPHLELRLQRVEKRIHLLEAETKGELDLSEFYAHPRPFEDPPHDPLT